MRRMQIDRLPFSLSWIRRQEKHRRLKSYYSTQEEADVCRRWERGETGRTQAQRTLFKPQRYTMDCTAKESLIQSQKYTCLLPRTPGDCSTSVPDTEKRECDNQTCTFLPHYAYLHILMGCFADDNYLLEYRIPK